MKYITFKLYISDVIRSAQHINKHWANVGKGPKSGSSLHGVTTSHTIDGSSHGAYSVEVDKPTNNFHVGVEGRKVFENVRIEGRKRRPKLTTMRSHGVPRHATACL